MDDTDPKIQENGFSALDVREVEGGVDGGRQLWKLLEPLVFSVKFNGDGGLSVRVPKGYVTDFASTPWYLQWLVPPTGKWMKAAVIHDYLCQMTLCSRFLADATFREGMYRLSIPWYRRVPMYYSVRVYAVTILPMSKKLYWKKTRT